MRLIGRVFRRTLKKARLQREMTQAGLAELVGVEPTTVSKWESGVFMPEDDKIKEIAKIFKLSVEELIEGRDPEEEGLLLASVILSRLSNLSHNERKVISAILLEDPQTLKDMPDFMKPVSALLKAMKNNKQK